MTKRQLKGLYDEMGRFLCNDFSEYPSLIEKLQEASVTNPNGRLEDIDGIIVWEKVEGNFGIAEFCEYIGIN